MIADIPEKVIYYLQAKNLTYKMDNATKMYTIVPISKKPGRKPKKPPIVASPSSSDSNKARKQVKMESSQTFKNMFEEMHS